MRFATSSVVVAVAALAASARAAPATSTAAAAPATTNAPVSGAANAITYPLGEEPLEAGKPITIKWEPNFGEKVTLSLRKGSDTNNLDNLVDIAVDVDNSGSLSWTPPKDLEAGGDYAIEIVSGSSANYSPQFSVDSSGTGLSSTKSSANTATTESGSSTKTSTATKSSSTDSESTSSSSSATRTRSSSEANASSEPTSTADASSEPDASSSPTETAAGADISAPAETSTNSAAGIPRSPLAFMVGLVAVLAFFN